MAVITSVLVVEGVLVGKEDEVVLAREQVDMVGRLLYTTLGQLGRLVLATNQPRNLIDHWARVHGLSSHGGITTLDDDVIGRLRAVGESPELYVDHDGTRCAAALAAGVKTMLFAQPRFARAAHRTPNALPALRQPWSQLVQESRQQRAEAAASPFAGYDEDSEEQPD